MQKFKLYRKNKHILISRFIKRLISINKSKHRLSRKGTIPEKNKNGVHIMR